MAKMGVYIPDAMAPVIEKWRGRLNYSQLFQDAVRKAIADMQNDEIEAHVDLPASCLMRETGVKAKSAIDKERTNQYRIAGELFGHLLERVRFGNLWMHTGPHGAVVYSLYTPIDKHTWVSVETMSLEDFDKLDTEAAIESRARYIVARWRDDIGNKRPANSPGGDGWSRLDVCEDLPGFWC